MIQQTSIDAFKKLKKSELNARQAEVIHAYDTWGEMNDKVLSRRIRREINAVTPRRYELVKGGLVEEKYRAKCPITGRKAIVWGLKK